MDTLEDLEDYYRHHFEIASMPISQRPVNSDLLTRSEREILGCTTKIDQALGIPTIMDSKSQRTFKKALNVTSFFSYLSKPFYSDIFFLRRSYDSLVQTILTICNFIWDIGLTLYGPSICGIIQVFFGDSSIIHLFLLCLVVSICVLIQVYFHFPPVYIILSGFPILWQIALNISLPSKNSAIPTFIERLTSYTREKRIAAVNKSNFKEADNATFTIKSGTSKRLMPEERAIALLKKLENDPY